jgi:cell division transport system permease protein
MILINVLASAALQSVERKVEVSLYFTPEASENTVKSAQGYLLGLSQVRDVQFVSADESLKIFSERHADNPTILSSLEEVGGNPFGASLVISAVSPDDFPFILEAMETPEYAPIIKEKDFTDYAVIIERIKTLSERVRLGGIMLSIFFALIAVLIIFNTIRVAIYVHRDEIAIMKLVGANDWFIRGPFLLEALLYSLVAVTLIAGGMLFLTSAFEPYVASYFGDINVSVAQYFQENALVIFGAQLLALSALSLLTTMYAMRRYLRV